MTQSGDVASLVEPVAFLVQRLTDDGKPFSQSLRFYNEPSSETTIVTPLVPASTLSSLQEENARLREALSGLLRCEYEAAGMGLYDCIDNTGKPYQSQFLADQIAAAERSLQPIPEEVGK